MLEMNWKQFWTEDWNLVGYQICEHEDRGDMIKHVNMKIELNGPNPTLKESLKLHVHVLELTV